MSRGHLVVLPMLLTLLVAAQARAQEGLDIERFKPATDSQGVILTEGGRGEKAGDLNLGFYLHYSRNPLVVTKDDAVAWSLVGDRLAANFIVSMGMTDWLTLAVDVPAVFYQDGDYRDPASGATLDLASAALGDIRVIPKLTVLREEDFGISIAVVAPISLPSGDDGAFTGSETVTAMPMLAASRRLIDDRLLLAVNLGVWLQKEADFKPERAREVLEAGHELFYRVGAGFRFADDWWALGELSAAAKLSNLGKNKPNETPLEWLLGLRYHAPHDLVFTAGGAVGSLPGWGTPNFRAFFGMTWSPRERDQDEDGIDDSKDRCPSEAGPEANGGCPWGDKDGDGLLDNEDRCVSEPGPAENAGCPWGDKDADGIADNVDKCPAEAGPKENGGCPWGDADADGIKDNQDKCPKVPGPAENGGCPWSDADGDGIKDADDKCPTDAGPVENHGCPWGDTDGDGLKDNVDKCPREPEDKDKFEDEDGCPDPDNDRDGVLDKDDECPDKPETINGYKDEDGCPDKGRQVVILKKEKIEILQKVHFATGKSRILPDSFSLLNQVAQVLRAHPEIKKMRVDGHTDSRGSERMNQRLSEKRATAVKDYMVNKGGVAPERLEAKGWGEAKPIADNKTRKGREANRRVEFLILDRE